MRLVESTETHCMYNLEGGGQVLLAIWSMIGDNNSAFIIQLSETEPKKNDSVFLYFSPVALLECVMTEKQKVQS